jgi:transcriptional regulator with XRE-family HTH domain
VKALNNKLLGERIKIVREEKKLTQDDIAKKLGLNKSTIQRYEIGAVNKIKLPVVQAIAEELGVCANWLAGESDEKYEKGKPLSKNDLKLALFDSTDVTDEELDEIIRMAKIHKMMKDEKKVKPLKNY